MNGVHDMGGMHGLGPIEAEVDEPLFHAPWEARALAITLAMGAWRKWNLDSSRHQRELIHGPDYLRMSYYEKWITGLIELMAKTGLVTRAEVASGRPANGASKATPPFTAGMAVPSLRRGSSVIRESTAVLRFKAGDRVRAKNINPTGHTRLPRYARGKLGTIAAYHGVHVFADSNAHFQGEQPQPLYSVRFTARELWGEAANPRDSVHIDLWEAHLEPA